MKLVYFNLFISSLYYFEIKMVLIKLDWHGNKIISHYIGSKNVVLIFVESTRFWWAFGLEIIEPNLATLLRKKTVHRSRGLFPQERRVNAEVFFIVSIKEQTILTCSLYRITFILILHWIMWSDEHRPFSSTSASVYESELVHSRPVNHVIIILPFCIYKRDQYFSTHEISKQIDL